MKTLRIVGLHYYTMTSLTNQWHSYLHNVGCDIEIETRYNNALLITWETRSPSAIHHILDMVEDTFGDSYDTSEVSDCIERLMDGHTVSFYTGYYKEGEVEID